MVGGEALSTLFLVLFRSDQDFVEMLVGRGELDFAGPALGEEEAKVEQKEVEDVPTPPPAPLLERASWSFSDRLRRVPKKYFRPYTSG